MKNLLLLILIVYAHLATSQNKPKPKIAAKDNRFSIEIQGIVLDNCAKVSDLTFGEFHGTDAEVERMKPNGNGEFKARYWLKEPGLFFFRKGSVNQYFLISPNEKVYKIGLSCTNNKLEPLQVFKSTENKAYQEFLDLRKELVSHFEDYRGKDLSDTIVFKEFADKIREYQRKSGVLSRKYVNSYVAKSILSVDRVGEKELAALSDLRRGYLRKASFADHKFYNTPLPGFLLDNYLSFIVDKKNPSFAAFEWVLNTASKNQTAAERLQDILFDAIQKNKRQDLMRGYITWARTNPDKLVNEITKFKLDGLSKSMVDAKFINIGLKDTLGITRELRDVVTASKYTLLVIYNPDCSHCIQTLPKLIPVGEQYQSKGLSIFTVAAKNDHTLWIDFIKKYTGAGWINVMEDQTNSSFGKYSISTLPSFVLIDGQGKIVCRMVADDVLTELQKWVGKL